MKVINGDIFLQMCVNITIFIMQLTDENMVFSSQHPRNDRKTADGIEKGAWIFRERMEISTPCDDSNQPQDSLNEESVPRAELALTGSSWKQ